MAALALAGAARVVPAPASPTPAPPRAQFGEVLRRMSPGAPPHAAPAPPLAALRRVEEVRARLDRALSEARAGRTFTAQELLALQADAYRYQHTVDVAAKVAEAGAQTVRQAVNTQV